MKKIAPLFLCPIFAVPLASSPSREIVLKIKYNLPFFATTVPLVIIGALSLLFFACLAWLFYLWRQSKYIFCLQCKTRNLKAYEFCIRCGARLNYPALTKEQKRWFSAFGWTKNPFVLNIIPATLAGREAAISVIIEKLNTLSGHILIIGGIGSGKTILLHWLENYFRNKYEVILALQPPDNPADLIALASSAVVKKIFGSSRNTDADILYKLCNSSRKKILLLLDKAQDFNKASEQYLLTLTNLPNVFLVMAGYSEVREMIKHDMPNIYDRIVETVFLEALTRNETEELIRKRIVDAGGKGLGPFKSQAIDEIHALGYGIPLKILKICDWAVANAVRNDKAVIDSPDIKAYLPGKQEGG